MRNTSIAGFGFVIAVVAAILVTDSVPSASQSATEISQYFANHRLAFLVAAWLGFPIVALFPPLQREYAST